MGHLRDENLIKLFQQRQSKVWGEWWVKYSPFMTRIPVIKFLLFKIIIMIDPTKYKV